MKDPIAIRPEQPGDYDAIDAVVRAAFLAEFGSASEVDLVRSLRREGELVEDLTLVAIDGDDIVGHLALSEVTVDGERVRGLGLAPVAVLPEKQNAGIGGRLIEAALDGAERSGWELVVLLGHEHYYSRFGFRPAAELGLTGDYGDHGGWMARPLGDATLPRGHVRYCSSFLT